MTGTDRASDGAAAVEMALILPLLVLLVFGVSAFGVQLFRSQSIQAAAREGGRVAAIGETYDSIRDRSFDEQTVVKTKTDLVVTVLRGTTPVSGSTVACRPEDYGSLVTVTVKLTNPSAYKMTIPFFGDVAPNLESKAVFRCE